MILWNTIYSNCYTCASGLYRTHQNIICTGECQRLFHVSCIDIDNNKFVKKIKANDSSCLEIYSSLDKIKVLNTSWLCAKCKHKRYKKVELPNFEVKITFEKKCLNVGLQILSKITKIGKK